MTVETALQQFADTARAFCKWAEEAPEGNARNNMLLARQHVVLLYSLALELPHCECDGPEPDTITHEAWQIVFKRFESLPVGYYSHCFDPLEVDTETTLGDLADDLADMWRDLKTGLSLFDGGHAEAAAYEWAFGFASHWGRHAASALHVLHCWIQSPGARLQTSKASL